MKLSTLTTSSAAVYHKILIYGPAKSGKTRLVGRLASTNQLVYFDNEQSTTTLLGPDNLDPKYLPNVELVRLRDSTNYPISCETVLRLTDGKPLTICDTHGKHDCKVCAKDANASFVNINSSDMPVGSIIVIDSLTQFTLSCINALKLGKGEEYKLQHDDWARLSAMVNKFCLWVQNINAHVICITHEEMLPMEDGKMRLVPAMGSSKFAPNTARFFDHIIYLKMNGKNHTAGSMTGFDMQAITGSRTNLAIEKVDQTKVYSPLSSLFNL